MAVTVRIGKGPGVVYGIAVELNGDEESLNTIVNVPLKYQGDGDGDQVDQYDNTKPDHNPSES